MDPVKVPAQKSAFVSTSGPVNYCVKLCHGDWYYSGGSITSLVVPLPLKSEGARGGREIAIAESTSLTVLKP